jgi:hypothetical protein
VLHAIQVETLNEALKIAALDIANTAGDQLLSDDEGEDEDELDNTRQMKTGGSRKAKAIAINKDGTYSFS